MCWAARAPPEAGAIGAARLAFAGLRIDWTAHDGQTVRFDPAIQSVSRLILLKEDQITPRS